VPLRTKTLKSFLVCVVWREKEEEEA